MKKVLLALLVLFSTQISFGQHIHGNSCSVGLEEGAFIKSRMLENRAKYDVAELRAAQSKNAITWIPVSLTIAGNNAGQGFTSLAKVTDMFCDLNNDFFDQNIQFFIKDSIHYLKNDAVHADAFTTAARTAMIAAKKSNSLNVFVGASVNNPRASYYTGWGDYVFMLNLQTSGTSNTIAHEVGHFLTLPHTFYGWENTPFAANFPPHSNAPTTINGVAVEYVTRTGAQKNCYTASDGFCDTQADYSGERVGCPYSGTAKDPAGVYIYPDSDNLMSYFSDVCRVVFSQEQKDAMWADLTNRNWLNFAAPANISMPSGTGITANNPSNGQQVILSGSTITLQWTADPNATGYVLKLERTIFGTPFETVIDRIVWGGANSFTFNSNLLAENRDYVWKVRPINYYNLCTTESAAFTFKVISNPTGTLALDNNLLDLNIAPNPVRQQQAQININSAKAMPASLSVYGMDGKKLVQQKEIQLENGSQSLSIDLSMLGTGLYVLVLTTEEGSVQKRFAIND